MRGNLVDLNETVRIGEYTFDPVSGELVRASPGGEGGALRLAPQPARLLALLASRRGEVVSHEEIRRTLWPDVQVDYERGLHFCVRQVREALDDPAGKPRYVETLPRRGYRLLADPPRARGAVPPRPVLRLTRRRLVLAAVGGVGLALAWGWLRSGVPAPRPAAVRVAILPFRPPAGFAAADGHATIAEQILVILDARLGERAELIGPTTTAVWEGGEAALGELAARLEPAYLVHGRYLVEGDRTRLIGELIRWPDGAHVWVEIFDPIPAAPEIAARVAAGAAAYLESTDGSPPR